MHCSVSAEHEKEDEAGPAPRAGASVSALLLPTAAPALLHCALKQVQRVVEYM